MEKERERESEKISTSAFLLEPLKTFHRWNLRSIEKVNIVEKLYTKNNPYSVGLQ